MDIKSQQRNYNPKFNNRKWNPNPKKNDAITIVINESLIELSLPYLVYKTKISKDNIPITRNIQAKTHNGIDVGVNWDVN